MRSRAYCKTCQKYIVDDELIKCRKLGHDLKAHPRDYDAWLSRDKWKESKKKREEIIQKYGRVPESFDLIKPRNKILDEWIDDLASGSYPVMGWSTRSGALALAPVNQIKQDILMYTEKGDTVGNLMCLGEDTYIVTMDALKKIKDVNIGDYVFTHKGRFRKVLNVLKRKYTGDMYIIKQNYDKRESLEITDEHPIYVYDKKRFGHKIIFPQESQFLWSTPSFLKKRLTGLPYPKFKTSLLDDLKSIKLYNKKLHFNSNYIKQKIKVDMDFMWFLGFYIAEGFRGGSSAVYLANSDKKLLNKAKKIVKNVFGLGSVIRQQASKTVYNLCIESKTLSCFLDRFGKNSINKHLTSDILHLPRNKLKYFLLGFFEGDGCCGRDSYQLYTSSIMLCQQLKMILSKFGIFPSIDMISPSQNGSYKYIRNRKVITKNYRYVVNIYGSLGQKRTNNAIEIFGKRNFKGRKTKRPNYHYLETDNYFIPMVKEIRTRKVIKKDVYNLEVEDDNSYCTLSFILHNCERAPHLLIANYYGRHSIGGDICKKFYLHDVEKVKQKILSSQKLFPEKNKILKETSIMFLGLLQNCKIELHLGDSRDVSSWLKDESVDFIITSPPYYKCATYDIDDKRQIGTGSSKYDEFLNKLKEIFQECFRVLKKEKFISVQVNDFRMDKKFYLYHCDVIRILNEIGFVNHDIRYYQVGTLSSIFASEMESQKRTAKTGEYIIVMKKSGQTKLKSFEKKKIRDAVKKIADGADMSVTDKEDVYDEPKIIKHVDRTKLSEQGSMDSLNFYQKKA